MRPEESTAGALRMGMAAADGGGSSGNDQTNRSGRTMRGFGAGLGASGAGVFLTTGWAAGACDFDTDSAGGA